jgi:hypothetical protein
MKTRISPRDWEQLSAYLDRQLKPSERSRLEARLQVDPGLRTALEELRRTRAVLRSTPQPRAPRKFTLTPEMVGARPARRLAPALGFVSALASIALIFVLIGDIFGRTAPAAPAAAPQLAAKAIRPTGAAVEAFNATSVEQGITESLPPPIPTDTVVPPAQAQLGAGAAPTEAPASISTAVTETLAERTGMAQRIRETPTSGEPATIGPITPGINVTPTVPIAVLVAPTITPPATSPEPTVTPTITIPTPTETPIPQTSLPLQTDRQVLSKQVPETTQPVKEGLPTPRILEVFLAVVALGTGLAAILLRRGISR